MKPSEFIVAVVMHFPVRHESPEREIEWTRSIVDAIKHYEGEILRRSAQRIIDSRTDRRFPLPAEIRKVCAQIAEEDRRGRLIVDASPLANRNMAWAADRMILARDLLKCETGRTAAREGWILGLWDFCRNNARLPVGEEVRRIKRESEEFTEAYNTAMRGGFAGARALVALGDQMMARRENLAESVLENSSV